MIQAQIYLIGLALVSYVSLANVAASAQLVSSLLLPQLARALAEFLFPWEFPSPPPSIKYT